MHVSKSTTIILVTFVTIILLGLWYISGIDERSAKRELAESPATRALSQSASSSPFTDLDGTTTDLGQYLGQVLVVTSWASWSPYSEESLILLAQAARANMQPDIVVLAINRGEPLTTATAYLRSIGVTDHIKLILDPADHYYATVGGYTMPETVFYDTRGNIVAHERGRLTQSKIATHLETAFAASQ